MIAPAHLGPNAIAGEPGVQDVLNRPILLQFEAMVLAATTELQQHQALAPPPMTMVIPPAFYLPLEGLAVKLASFTSEQYGSFLVQFLEARQVIYPQAAGGIHPKVDMRYVLNFLNIYGYIFQFHSTNGFGWRIRSPPDANSHFTNIIIKMSLHIVTI